MGVLYRPFACAALLKVAVELLDSCSCNVLQFQPTQNRIDIQPRHPSVTLASSRAGLGSLHAQPFGEKFLDGGLCAVVGQALPHLPVNGGNPFLGIFAELEGFTSTLTVNGHLR